MPKDEAGNEIVVDEKKDDALSILEEVKAALAKNKEENPVKTDPQPPVNNDRRKAFMEQNKLNEDQVRLIEAGQVTDQKLALMEVRQNNKDYELLEKDFLEEVKKYNGNFRIVDSTYANDLFMAVKGRAITQGRYQPPSSQPDRKQKPSDSRVVESRIAGSGFTPGAGGQSTEEEKPKSGADSLSDREKTYADIIGVEHGDYAVEKEKKRLGIREVADKAFRVPERLSPGTPGANSADFALNDLSRRHGVRA